MPADDRTAAVEHLSVLLQCDLVALEDFDPLVQRLLATTTRSELGAILAALPTTVRMTPPERRLNDTLVLSARSGVLKLNGRWQLGADTEVHCDSGIVKLDLRNAEFDDTLIELDLDASSGVIDVIVPRGVAVQMIEVSARGVIKNSIEAASPLPGLPCIRVSARTNSGVIRLQHPKEPKRRRWFRGWLRSRRNRRTRT